MKEDLGLLLSLSCSGISPTNMKVGRRRRRKRSIDGMFECKTCSRLFPSFQALGGHRASHERSCRIVDSLRGSTMKKMVNKCTICGLGFATGQSLGGHMRCHKTMAPNLSFDLNAIASVDSEDRASNHFLLDLFK